MASRTRRLCEWRARRRRRLAAALIERLVDGRIDERRDEQQQFAHDVKRAAALAALNDLVVFSKIDGRFGKYRGEWRRLAFLHNKARFSVARQRSTAAESAAAAHTVEHFLAYGTQDARVSRCCRAGRRRRAS